VSTGISSALRPLRPLGLLRTLDAYLVAPGSPHRFACARTVLAATIGLRLALRRWEVLADKPPELFRPVLLVSWLTQVPAAGVLVAAQVVGTTCAVLAAIGRRPRLTFAVAWMMLLFLAGLRTSAGKILHNDVLLLLAAVPVLFGPARARIGDRRPTFGAGWPVRAGLAVVGSVYLLTGLQKLRHSGLEWVTSDNFRWVLYSGAASGRAPIRAVALAIADRAWLAHLVAAGLLAFTIVFYVAIYTMWLKRRTAQNIVIGGAAGALPPLVGWAAMTGGVALEPLLLFLVIFMWTPPHFWALALFTHGDYQRAGVPMMPNVAGAASTRLQILVYSLLLAPIGALPWLLGHAGPAYGVAAALLGAEFVRRAALLWRRGDAGDNRAAKRLFGFSIVYLFALFAVRLVEAGAATLMGN